MKKVLLITGLITAMVMAYPAIGGGKGLFYTRDVKPEGAGNLTLSLHALGTNYQGWYQLGLHGGVTYSPLDWIKAWVSPTYEIWSEDFTMKNVQSGFYDTQTGLQFAFLSIPVFKLGALAALNIPTLNYKNFPGLTPETTRIYSSTVGGLVALDFGDISKVAPFNFLINTFYRTGKYDSLIVRAGIELPAKTYSIMLEVSTEQSFSSLGDFSNNPFRFTPGVKFTFPFGMGIDLGLDIATFSKVIPRFQGVVGLSFITPFFKSPQPALGNISGSVQDAVTGRSISAQAIFPGSTLQPVAVGEDGVLRIDSIPAGIVTVQIVKSGYADETAPLVVKKDETTTHEFKLQPLHQYGILSGTVRDSKTSKPLRAKITVAGFEPKITNSETGFFQFDSMPVGSISVEASAGGYLHDATSATIKANEVTKVDFALKPSLSNGTIIGQVTDRKDGKVLKASISFPKSDVPPVLTDPATGIYKATISTGSYAIVVKADGYIDQPATLVVEEDKTTEKNFQLVKIGMTITLRGILFDFDKATLQPASYKVLDDAAQILKDNPTIRVEIQGHTDAVGSDAYNQKLSEDRAATVVNYFITKHQIDANRLVARGYGESKPISSNDTAAGRDLNRRVEFVVLGQIGG
jgi:outer membrane protein OmpA-like peptidoglycan-associated protein